MPPELRLFGENATFRNIKWGAKASKHETTPPESVLFDEWQHFETSNGVIKASKQTTPPESTFV